MGEERDLRQEAVADLIEFAMWSCVFGGCLCCCGVMYGVWVLGMWVYASEGVVVEGLRARRISL